MSRFYKSAMSSDSESESESSGGEGELIQKGPVRPQFQFSDDEEDVKRVVRSEKEKRFEGMNDVIKVLKNHKKIKDMANVLTDFENLTKAYEKAKKVVVQEGIPRFYIRTLVELEDYINECWEDRVGRKLMSKNGAKGLTTLRQKLKKYLRDYETETVAYRENPDKEDAKLSDSDKDSDSEDDDDDDDDEDGGELGGPMKAADFLKKEKSDVVAKPKDDDEESDSDDDMWASSGGDSSSSSSDDEDYGGNLAAKFLKKTGDAADKKDKAKRAEQVKEQARKEKKRRKDSEEDDGEGEWEEVVKGGAPMKMEKPKMFAKDAEINHESVFKKLTEIISGRGKKGTDRTEQIDLLLELNSIASAHTLGHGMFIKIMFHMIAAIFDYNPNIATCMRAEMWEKCVTFVHDLLQLLEANEDITVGENIMDENEQLEEAPFRIRGCILAMTERMDEEFTKMLQACDAHSTEYVDRLKDEQKVCDVICTLQGLIEKKALSVDDENEKKRMNDEICRVYFLRIKHIYYKFDHQGALMQKQRANNETPEVPEGYIDTYALCGKLCKHIYGVDNTDRIRTRAILCHIYHHALHDRWYEARDLMMMSHLQDNIQHSDVPTQIYYNRSMVQLGLCAFRQGMVKDAHHCLVDIQSGGRAKELLAQGLLLQRQHERTAEQEKIEKRRQMPYHMHINLELLECVYLVSAMLMEIPYMAAHELDARRRMISKNFHHVLKLSERQPLVGPPESMREHVVAASKAMKTGDWRACKNYIINEKMNAKVWDLFYNVDNVRDMITNKIQEESLRTYLFTYSSVYDSISLETLSEMFELLKGVVHSIISKMIINEELMASLDEPTQTVMMHRTEPTRLQALALQLSEKVASLVDNNERILEMKQGNYFSYQKDRGQGNQGYHQGNRGGWKDGGNRFNRDRGDNRYQRGGGRGGGGGRNNYNQPAWKQSGGRDNRQQRNY